MKYHLVAMMLFSIVFMPMVSATNVEGSFERPEYQEFVEPSSHVNEITPNGPTVIAYVCGYNVDGETRGDDCDGKTVQEAPREIWFRYAVPENAVGDFVTFTVENLGDPHYVDVEVEFCHSVRYSANSQLNCGYKTDLYQGDSTSSTTTSIASDDYWIRVVGFDESKEQRSAGGDLTKISVTTTKLSSNGDRIEPEELFPNVKKDRAVCNVNCDDQTAVDPLDVYMIKGYKGDEVTFKVGSREADGIAHRDVVVYYAHERDINSGNVTQQFIMLNDQGSFNIDQYVSTVTYQFGISGKLMIWVQALTDDQIEGGNSDEKVESYSIEFVEMVTTNRDFRADLDGDGMADYEEFLCGSDFNYANSTAPNHDGDNSCDSNDEDDDNDGILDEDDPCRTSPMNEADFDFDGCTNSEDDDDDNDGVIDSQDDCDQSINFDNDVDTDADGCWNNYDLDDDNDGYADQEEESCGTDPLDSSSVPSDLDGDGICDQNDPDVDGDSIANANDPCPNSTIGALDHDGDGCEDAADNDDDNDGILDAQDDCPRGQMTGDDLDQDGCKDSEDNDVDGDGFSRDIEERCGSSDQDGDDVPSDFDLDGECDQMDNDDDNDGTTDSLDAFPKDSSETADNDGDGIGNNADNDDDNDNVLDSLDAFPFDSSEWSDIDEDGIGDNTDTDKDGDGFLNVDELRCGSDATVSTSVPDDFDSDGLCDFDDENDDGDGWSDSDERQCGTDPLDPQNQPKDKDGDTECDSIDLDRDGDGIVNDADDCPDTDTDGKDSNKDGCVDSFVESTAGRTVMIGGGSLLIIILVVIGAMVVKGGNKIDNSANIDNSMNMKLMNSNMGDLSNSPATSSRQGNSDLLSKMSTNERSSRLNAPNKKEKFNSLFKNDEN